MTDQEKIKELTEKLEDAEKFAANLAGALRTLGQLLRNHALELRKDARMLQGLQGKCYTLAEKLDDYSAQVFLGTLPKEKKDETASH